VIRPVMSNRAGHALVNPGPRPRPAGWCILLSIAVVMSLTLPACSDGGDAGSEVRKGGSAAGAAAKVEGAPPQAPPAPPPPPPPPAPPPPARPQAAPRRAPAGRTANPAPAPAPGVTGPARPGIYEFDETGLIKTVGCLVTNQRPPSPTRLNVGALTGNRQQFDRDQRGPDGSGSSTSSLREYRDDGLYVVSLHQVQMVLQNSIVADFAPSPPVLVVPARPDPGQAWGFVLTSTDGKIRIDTANRVEETNEPITLGQGTAVRAVRIRSTAHVTGTSSQGVMDFTVTRLTWYARDQHLEVKEVTDTAGRVGLCSIDFHTEALVRSV
jgi:hypothetical protein